MRLRGANQRAGKYWHRWKKSRPVEYSTSPDYHRAQQALAAANNPSGNAGIPRSNRVSRGPSVMSSGTVSSDDDDQPLRRPARKGAGQRSKDEAFEFDEAGMPASLGRGAAESPILPPASLAGLGRGSPSTSGHVAAVRQVRSSLFILLPRGVINRTASSGLDDHCGSNFTTGEARRQI